MLNAPLKSFQSVKYRESYQPQLDGRFSGLNPSTVLAYYRWVFTSCGTDTVDRILLAVIQTLLSCCFFFAFVKCERKMLYEVVMYC